MGNLLSYFRQELQLLSQQGKYFSRRFPVVAQKLGMSKGNFDDPHTARLMESFALLTAQIHRRLDEDLPEIAHGVMQNLAPQLLRDFPSTCIVHFSPHQQQSGMTQVRKIAPGFELDTRAIREQHCRFVTHYPLSIWPASISDARLTQSRVDNLWRLNLTLTPWSGTSIREKHLRIWLQGSEDLVNTLHSLLCTQVQVMTICYGEHRAAVSTQQIRMVGFEMDELLLHKQARIAPTQSMMLDFSLFPQRFHFIDLPLPDDFLLSGSDRLEWNITFKGCWITAQLAELAPLVSKETFQINCTPAINLFGCRADPITLRPDVAEYPIVADVKAQHARVFWSVETVKLRHLEEEDAVTLIVPPLLGLDNYQTDNEQGLFWQAVQREQLQRGEGVIKPFIAFSDRRPQGSSELSGIVMLEILCTNGALPAELANGHPNGDFSAQVELPGITINALTRPGSPVQPPQGTASVWRLISQLTLNHLLLGDEEGCRYLKESLSLYNLNDCPHLRQAIALIRSLSVTPVSERLVVSDPHSYARGVDIEVTFAAEARSFSYYTLFCCFLDRLLGLYAPVNSFSRLITYIEGLDESRQRWPIRAGRLSWL